MCSIQNKRITVALFRLIFEDEWVGNAFCTYDYNSGSLDYSDLLKVEIDIVMPFKKPKSTTYKLLKDDIKCSTTSSQSFEMILEFLKQHYIGVKLEHCRSNYEFYYTEQSDTLISLILIESAEIPYEITNLKTGKSYSFADKTEKDAIILGYENLLN